MTESKKPEVEIYTDGACSGNPGRGGYGAILRYKTVNGIYVEKELSQGFLNTTNNRMEILGAAVALETLKKPCRVILCSDSKYLTDTIEKKRLDCWITNGWKTSAKKNVKNVDLWLRLANSMKPHQIEWVWIKGHNGHKFNERCDKLAVAAYNSDNLKTDTGYLLNKN